LAWSTKDTSDLLLIEGKPGSGKSTFTKYFKRNFLERVPLARQSVLASFFYSNREGELQSDHSNMLRSILYDVLKQNETFFYHFQIHYRNALKPGKYFEWDYDSLKKILRSFGDHPAEERIYLIVDAMDESNDATRNNIIQLLYRLGSTKKCCIVKIFVASRPIAEMNQTLSETPTIKLQDMNGPDIEKFAMSFLGPNLNLPQEILRDITEYIVNNADGVFVWVYLVTEEFGKYAKTGCTRKEIFEFLTSLPIELEGFYKRILDKLENNDQRDVRVAAKIFQFVLFTFRPLSVPEIHHALAIPGIHVEFSPTDESFYNELIHGIKGRIVHCGGNFLEIKEESSSVFP